MRLRKIKYASSMINDHPEYMVLEPKIFKEKWNDLFVEKHPIHIEIGCGKGQFIYGMASAFPNINFIGIEKYDSVIIRALDKLIENELPNVLLIQQNADQLEDFFVKGEVSKIYLNFSDPWPKKRQEKRRLTNPVFLSKYKNILGIGSSIVFKSDNYALFEYSLMQFNEDNDFSIEKVSSDIYNDNIGLNIATEFETKFVELGKPIYYIHAQYKKETRI